MLTRSKLLLPLISSPLTVRVGNPQTANGAFRTPGSGVVRVLRAYPYGWAVFAMGDGSGGVRAAVRLGELEARPTYKQLEELLLNKSWQRDLQVPTPSGSARQMPSSSSGDSDSSSSNRNGSRSSGGGSDASGDEGSGEASGEGVGEAGGEGGGEAGAEGGNSTSVAPGQLAAPAAGGGVPLGRGMGEWADSDSSDGEWDDSNGEPPLFTVTEIDAMYKRMLQKALMAYGAPSAGKLDDLRQRLKFTQAKRMLESAAGGGARRGRRRGLAPTECRVCNSSGRRTCPSCGLAPTTVNLDCALCGGWGYVLCPACEGGRRPPFPAAAGPAAEAGGALEGSEGGDAAEGAEEAPLAVAGATRLPAWYPLVPEAAAPPEAAPLAASPAPVVEADTGGAVDDSLNRLANARVTRARASLESATRGQLAWACRAAGLSADDSRTLSDEALVDWLMRLKAKDLLAACERQRLPMGTSTKGRLIARLCAAAPPVADDRPIELADAREKESPGALILAMRDYIQSKR